jgi:predicted Zn-dependent protease
MRAARFHDGHSGAIHTVQPFVFGRELRLVDQHDATVAVWKLDDIQAAPELDPDGAVTLTARGQPGQLLIDASEDIAALRGMGLGLPGRKAWSRGLWGTVAASLVATLALGVLAVTILPAWIAAVIPIAWEQRLGEPAMALLFSHIKRCDSPAGQAALDRLVNRLRTAGGIEMPVTLAVLDDRTINALTLPGGHVLVLRGLIRTATDGPMLAGVIAHELGHVAHRDTTTLLLRNMGVTMLLNTIGLGDPGTAAAGASNLLGLAYTRRAEAAADAFAIDVQTKAGLRADGLSRFFTLMEQRETATGATGDDDKPHQPGESTESTLSWFATHPATEARREETERPPTGDEPFTDDDFHAIKAMCAKQ